MEVIYCWKKITAEQGNNKLNLENKQQTNGTTSLGDNQTMSVSQLM